MSIKHALQDGDLLLANQLSHETSYQCISICRSELDVVDFLIHVKKTGGECGGLSGSDFFVFPGHFVVTWTPDWSSLLELFPDDNEGMKNKGQ